MKRLALWTVLVLLFTPHPCPAAENVSLSLKLDRAEATLVDSVVLTVSLSGTRSSDSKPLLRGLGNFNVSQGGTSSRVEIINGKVSAGIDFTYFIQPQKPGTFQIGPAEVRLEGKRFTSNTEILKVVKPARAAGVDRGPLFLEATLSAPEIYVEEQAIYTLKLYRRARVSDISLNLPQMEDIELKQLGKPLEYQRAYNGQNYQVLEVRYALIPFKEGDTTIAPSTMRMTVFQSERRSPRSRMNDLFSNDPFFSFSSGRPIKVTSEPLELKVRPLPLDKRPVDFGGLVGSFKIESKLEPTTIKAGEAATLTVILSGRGNVNRVPDLKVPELAHTKLYADQPVLEVNPDAKGIAGSKTMKWALVPDQAGSYQVAPIKVSFFDTGDQRYREIETAAHTLSVLPGEPISVSPAEDQTQEPGVNGPVKEPVKELARDILPVHTSIRDFMPVKPKRPGGPFSPLFLLLPVTAYLIALFTIRVRRKSLETSAATIARKAAGVLIKQCRHGRHSAQGLTLLTKDYLNARLGLFLGSLTPDEAMAILTSRGVRPETAAQLQAILQQLENAVYTGKGDASCDLSGNLPELIKQIEKEIQ